MVTVTKAALHILCCMRTVEHNTSPQWFLYHLEKDVKINAIQEPPELLMPFCIAPATDIRVVEVLPEDPGFWIQDCSYVSAEGIILLDILVVWPVAAPLPITSIIPAFPLILTHKLWVSSSYSYPGRDQYTPAGHWHQPLLDSLSYPS